MQKIAFLINSLSSGGAEKVLSILVAELINQNFDVEVIFLEKNEFYILPKEVKRTYLSTFDSSQSGIEKLIYIPILAYKLKNYIKKNNIILIQSHVFRANYINILAKLFGSNHIAQVVTAGRISRYKELGLLGKINLFLIKFLYPKADLIISKANGMKEDMKSLFNFTNKQIVINNPYDIKQIEKLSIENIDNFTFHNNKKYLISIGRLIPLKRNHELISILTELSNNIEIIFLGDGSEKNRLIDLTKELKLEKRVHFLGQVSNPYKYLSKSDILVSCSESEGFPNVLVEAMICGVAVVSSDCISGPKEILQNNKYGLLFEVGDNNKMIENINLLLNNNDIRNEYIKKAKIRSNDFSLNNIIDKYKKVLEIDKKNSNSCK
jgi:N-acetylgalactosamine-N,N'-diacetylbacillosaminyl-diphospho-undecaprenol 4-alpha-N-acetylgalactosaminyltransferase